MSHAAMSLVETLGVNNPIDVPDEDLEANMFFMSSTKMEPSANVNIQEILADAPLKVASGSQQASGDESSQASNDVFQSLMLDAPMSASAYSARKVKKGSSLKKEDTSQSRRHISFSPEAKDNSKYKVGMHRHTRSATRQNEPPTSSPPSVPHVQATPSSSPTANSEAIKEILSLLDRGANGSLMDKRCARQISESSRIVDVIGVENLQVRGMKLGTWGTVINSNKGKILAIIHQTAGSTKNTGNGIISVAQLEAFGCEVDDKSVRVGGSQSIKTPEGYVIPMQFKDGLSYVLMRPFTNEEWDTLPHVVLTSDKIWDPTCLDYKHGPNWADTIENKKSGVGTGAPFDEFGNYIYTDRPGADEFEEDFLELQHLNDPMPNTMRPIHIYRTQVKLRPEQYEELRPHFLFANKEVVEKTIGATTDFGRTPKMNGPMYYTHKSPFPAMNVRRRNEAVATDTIFSDTACVATGVKMAQIFVGRDSLLVDIFGMKTQKEFVNTLLDEIRFRGAMDTLISDRAKVEISKRVKDILRHLFIKAWQSEPYFQWQDFAERGWRDIKRISNWVLQVTGSEPNLWLLCCKYVAFVMNRLARKKLGWRTPEELVTGQTPDIHVIKQFVFNEPVYIPKHTGSFPSGDTEIAARFVGFAENVGHAYTYKFLTEDTKQIVYRSQARRRGEDFPANLRAEQKATAPDVVKSVTELKKIPMPNIDAKDLLGRTFLKPPEPDGTRHRAKIVEILQQDDALRQRHPDLVRFRCTVGNDEFEEVVAYNDLLDYIEKDEFQEGVWKFKQIIGHEGPLRKGHPDHKGSLYNVQVLWETGETSWEPLHLIKKCDPVTLAIYAKEKGLLSTDGWKGFRRLAKRHKVVTRLLNQAKLKSFRTAPRYKFGFLVPRDHYEAMKFDEVNGNTRWRDSELVELHQIDDYKTFENRGHKSTAQIPEGYKKIGVHMVYDVKHDGRHKSRLVADGHLTPTPVDSVYSSVVSLRSVRIIAFLAELNGLELYQTDIGNAYLESYTKEKVYIIAGPEFGEREGCVLIIRKALYGLKSSGKRWHERCAEVLRSMGYFPCKMDPDVWMRDMGDYYEYIGVYVDDMEVAARVAKKVIDEFTETYNLKVKGTGPIHYHLGCDFYRDAQGRLCISPKKYVEKMVDSYKNMFGSAPKQYKSPLEEGDHPELDTSEELDLDGIKKYQSLIGSLQWAVSLGRFDITTAVMTMSSFRANPRKGHLERVKRMVGYLSKFRHAAIRVRTEKPDYSHLPDAHYDWEKSVYGNVTEEIPKDCPRPLGPEVVTTTFKDANLYHDLATGRAVTGILHLLNKTPVDWFSKKQGTVETSTYGSEFVAGRIAVEQIMDLRLTLRYMGVNLVEKSYLFGDNKSVVDSSTTPHAKLHKRHTALSFHRIREAIASGLLAFFHIPGKENPADILSKHWGYSQVWPQLQALLFWQGNTFDLLRRREEKELKDEIRVHV